MPPRVPPGSPSRAGAIKARSFAHPSSFALIDALPLQAKIFLDGVRSYGSPPSRKGTGGGPCISAAFSQDAFAPAVQAIW